jgi:hypothetical protein
MICEKWGQLNFQLFPATFTVAWCTAVTIIAANFVMLMETMPIVFLRLITRTNESRSEWHDYICTYQLIFPEPLHPTSQQFDIPRITGVSWRTCPTLHRSECWRTWSVPSSGTVHFCLDFCVKTEKERLSQNKVTIYHTTRRHDPNFVDLHHSLFDVFRKYMNLRVAIRLASQMCVTVRYLRPIP